MPRVFPIVSQNFRFATTSPPAISPIPPPPPPPLPDPPSPITVARAKDARRVGYHAAAEGFAPRAQGQPFDETDADRTDDVRGVGQPLGGDMTPQLPERFAEQAEKFPPELRALLDAELAAGNEVIDLEFGRGPDKGKVALVVRHPYRAATPGSPPPGLSYFEITTRNPQIFVFRSSDERFSLVAAKFKPMVLQPLPRLSDPPTPKKLPETKKPDAPVLSAPATPGAESAKPQAAGKDPDAMRRFRASMVMDYEKWHDGIGYDLGALDELSEPQVREIERTLISHQPRDWRDIEALAYIDSPRAREVVEAALKSSDAKVRAEAMRHAGDKADPKGRERKLIASLKKDDIWGGLSEAIDEVEEFHPPAVIEQLFRGALNRDGEAAVHFAALILFLHGKAKEPFDWDHRPFFLRFNTSDRAERKAVFRELCERVGVDLSKYRQK